MIGEDTPLLSRRNAGAFRENHKYKYFGGAVFVILAINALLVTINKHDIKMSATIEPKNVQNTSHNNRSTSVFPTNFLWGAATSAYQIEGGASEGGRGPSIWDTWCLESSDNCNGETGNITDDHFHHWQEDIELMHSLGLKAYRFSISWSRILPTGVAEGTESGDHRYSKTKGINYDGVEFYNRIIDSLISKGIEPFITLYHWDLPQSLQDAYGGWEDEQIIEDFARVRCYIAFINELSLDHPQVLTLQSFCFWQYARICFQFFGDRVKYWITVNEAWTVAIGGYEQGTKAPGLLSEEKGGLGKPYLIAHHLLLAHARAVGVYREEGYSNWYFHGSSNTTGMIGISHSGDYRFPVNPNSREDRDAATRAMEFQIGWLVSIWMIFLPLYHPLKHVLHIYLLD